MTDKANESNGERGRRGPRYIAVSGAKGGVGKTTFAANVALCLANLGRKVVLVDADRLGANAHTALGMQRPFSRESTPGALRAGSSVDNDLQILQTPYPNLWLAYSGVDEACMGLRSLRRFSRLKQQIEDLDAVHVVVDLGDGHDGQLIDLFFQSDFPLFLVTPDPAAIENIQRFVRASFFRKLSELEPVRGSRDAWRARLRTMYSIPSPVDLLQRLEAEGDPMVAVVREVLRNFSFYLMLNQARVRQDTELGEEIVIATRRRLGVNLKYLGYLGQDEAISMCLRKRRPLMIDSPGSKASRGIERVVRRVLLMPDRLSRLEEPALPVSFDSHYGILELGRGAAEEEIRRAYKRMKLVYGPEGLASYGLFLPEQREALLARLDEAHEVLLDPNRRRVYDRTLFPEVSLEEEKVATQVVPKAEALAAFPELGPETQFNGALLKAIREAHGVDLKYLSNRTKIGQNYLSAIEEDAFESLPERVYVRGYLAELAKIFHLDPKQVSRTYLRAFEQARPSSS
ncbi:MAG: helix-turn-helix domain-containing protein [Myxococcales bacterium]|nr:MAG: helix-turn-helix domain-containing protein [Myxococcales bacterium]